MKRDRRLVTRNSTIPIIFLIAFLAAGPVAHAQNSDFTLNATPSNLCVNPGVDAVSQISVQSLGGFSGTVNLGDSIGPNPANAPTLSAIPSSVDVASGQTVSFSLTISTTTSTPNALYTITVSGLSGATIHQATVELTVAAGCSVGGTILPISEMTSIRSLASVALLLVAVASGAGLMVYLGQHGRRKTA